MKNSDLISVKCTLHGDSKFVMDIVQYLGERLKFKGDVFKVRRSSDNDIIATMDILGFFCTKKGKLKKAKNFRAECVPDISLFD